MPKTMSYTPAPLDTSGVTLPEELDVLVEELARNVHEVWALGRISEGWTYGPLRDDDRKHHPCLMPYENLPEHEKDYDRHTVRETLKVITLLGFRVEKSRGGGDEECSFIL